MAHANFESPLLKSAGSAKRSMSPEDQRDRNLPKRLQSIGANDSDTEGGSNGDYISGDKKSPTPMNDYNSFEPQQPSTSVKTLTSIEVSHHPRHSESNVPPLERIGDTIGDTIEDDPNEISSEYLEPTTDGHHTSSTPPTQRSRELTVEDDKSNSILPHAASSPPPSPIHRVNFSPPPPSVSSSHTSISEDDSDEENWDDEMFNL
ncbi:hypothetical protein B0T13DRAFT_486045 [Neurospora crassa]|nr:hypothetical protein B0T13DRAFT_486045 [Neurospora crassa]